MESQTAGMELGLGCARARRAVSLFVEFHHIAFEQETHLARNSLRTGFSEFHANPQEVSTRSPRQDFKFGVGCWENPPRLLHRRSASLPCRLVWKFPRADSTAGRRNAPTRETRHAPVPLLRWTPGRFLPAR